MTAMTELRLGIASHAFRRAAGWKTAAGAPHAETAGDACKGRLPLPLRRREAGRPGMNNIAPQLDERLVKEHPSLPLGPRARGPLE